MSNPAFGQETPGSISSEYNMLHFVVWQILSTVQTLTLVKVVSCTNSGGLSPVGTVTVQPIINQMTGNRQAVPHGELTQVPYVRIQGGANAIILDPKPDDVGVVGFCSRDIGAAKASRSGPVNPTSFAMFDWADGIYLGNIFGGIPTRYIQFTDSGINIVAPDQITIQAPTVTIAGSSAVNIAGGHTSIDGKSFLTHTHTGVQTGGSNSGPVT